MGRKCDAQAAFALTDIELYAKRAAERPLQCLLTMSHTHLLGAHVALRNVELDRPPLCNIESLVDDELGNALFSCDAQTSRTDLRLRLCPCALPERATQLATDMSIERVASVSSATNDDNTAQCEKGFERRYGRCAPCALGEYGGGGNESCRRCPSERLRSRAYFSRIAARTLDECAVSCAYGDDAARNGRCPSISRSPLAKTLWLFCVYITVIVWLATERCLLFAAVVQRLQSGGQ